MRGARPMSPEEVELVLSHLGPRDKLLFLLGLYTGFRITELLSLRLGDVLGPLGCVNSRVQVARRSMKGKESSRSVLIHPRVKQLLNSSVHIMDDPTLPLFPSSRVRHKPLGRIQAWKVLKRAFEEAGLTGPLSTHSMRKTFADRAYDHFDGNIFKVARALGHRTPEATMAYLSFKTEELDEAVLRM